MRRVQYNGYHCRCDQRATKHSVADRPAALFIVARKQRRGGRRVFNGRHKTLVARWVGIEDDRVKATWDSVGNGTVICPDDYRHRGRAYRCTTMNAGAFSRREGVS